MSAVDLHLPNHSQNLGLSIGAGFGIEIGETPLAIVLKRFLARTTFFRKTVSLSGTTRGVGLSYLHKTVFNCLAQVIPSKKGAVGNAYFILQFR